MRRDQLEHAIRVACQITQQSEVIVVGSQAILGTVLARLADLVAPGSLVALRLPATLAAVAVVALTALIASFSTAVRRRNSGSSATLTTSSSPPA